MNVSVFGLGYVGLTTALFINKAKIGLTVGYDINITRVGDIWSKTMPFYEPELDILMENHRVAATCSASSALSDLIDMVIVCVGTPSDENGSVNLSYVWDVMETIGKRIATRKHKLVIMLKSTVIPGTSRKCINIIEQHSGKKHGEDFGFITCPEFLREGSALKDMELPDMIVMGYEFQWEIEFARGFFMELYLSYGSLLAEEITWSFFPCSYENAEFIKYANNGFLATKISYINELANIVECVPGADIKVIAKAIGMDNRINPRFLGAGVGFGGSCFSKDVKALVKFAEDQGHTPTMLDEVLAVNLYQRDWVDSMLTLAFGGEWSRLNKRIAVLGLAFKPGTDDVRDSPAIDICELIHHKGGNLIMHDPKAMKNFESAVSFPCRFANIENTLLQADCAVILTDWPEYKALTAETFKKYLKHPIVIDGRRIYDPHEFYRAGIRYYGVGYGAGRAPVPQSGELPW